MPCLRAGYSGNIINSSIGHVRSPLGIVLSKINNTLAIMRNKNIQISNRVIMLPKMSPVISQMINDVTRKIDKLENNETPIYLLLSRILCSLREIEM